MLVEGRGWVDRCFSLVPSSHARAGRRWATTSTGRWPVRDRKHRDQPDRRRLVTLVFLILGVPYAVALGLLVADPRPHPARGRDGRRSDRRGVAFLHRCPRASCRRLLHRLPAGREPRPPTRDLRPNHRASPLAVWSPCWSEPRFGHSPSPCSHPVAVALQVIIRDQIAHRRAALAKPRPDLDYDRGVPGERLDASGENHPLTPVRLAPRHAPRTAHMQSGPPRTPRAPRLEAPGPRH